MPAPELQPGPIYIDCPCGCELVGTLTSGGHVRRCRCKSCIGRRNRRSGLAKQRGARKRLGVPPARTHGLEAHEENYRDPLFVEEIKSGLQVGQSHFLRAEAQAEAARATGDHRSFRYTAIPAGWGSEGLVTVRLSVWEEIVRPALESYYGVRK